MKFFTSEVLREQVKGGFVIPSDQLIKSSILEASQFMLSVFLVLTEESPTL